MRPIAEFIMRGRVQATLLAGVAAALPMLFWLSAATAGLVLLRKGAAQSGNVMIAALVPAFIWMLMGDPLAFLVIGCTLVLAAFLRQGMVWRSVLMLSVGLAGLCMLVFGTVFADTVSMLAAEVLRLMPMVFDTGTEPLDEQGMQAVQALVVPVLVGLLAASVQLLSLLSLIIARYWQALLYNPGGFKQEFHSIRLPKWQSAVLVMVMLLSPAASIDLAGIGLLCAVALVMAGISCVHGLAAKRAIAGFYLTCFYLLLVPFNQFLFPLLCFLALIDSMFDLRGLSRAGKDNA